MLGFPALDVLQVFFNAVLVVTAIVGSFVIYRQLDVMEQQMADARAGAADEQKATNRSLAIAESQAASLKMLAEAMNANERARLYVQNVFTVRACQVGQRMSVLMEVANSGRTAAKHVASNVMLEVLPKGRVPNLRGRRADLVGDYTIPPNAGGAGVQADMELMRNGKRVGELTKALYDQISAGHAVIFLHGRIEYRDIGGGQHWISVCRVYRPDLVNVLSGTEGQWWACKETQGDTGDYSP